MPQELVPRDSSSAPLVAWPACLPDADPVAVEGLAVPVSGSARQRNRRSLPGGGWR
jgi:hypothetical protein